MENQSSLPAATLTPHFEGGAISGLICDMLMDQRVDIYSSYDHNGFTPHGYELVVIAIHAKSIPNCGGVPGTPSLKHDMEVSKGMCRANRNEKV